MRHDPTTDRERSRRVCVCYYDSPTSQELAEADEDKVITQVQEYFADFQAIDRMLFTLDLSSNHLFLQPMTWNSQGTQYAMDRAVGWCKLTTSA